MNKEHPGSILKNLCLDKLNLSITDAANHLKMTRSNLSLIINGKMGISASMAIKLAIVFNTSAEEWMKAQVDYDIQEAKKKKVSLKCISKKRIRIVK